MPIMAELGVGLLVIVQKPWEKVRDDFDVYRETWAGRQRGRPAGRPSAAASCSSTRTRPGPRSSPTSTSATTTARSCATTPSRRPREIRAIQQLLRAKYFLYARKDPRRDKEITDLGHTAKTAYSKFEYSLQQVAEEGKAGEVERPAAAERDGGPFLFFRDEENQVMFLRNWRILQELDYEISASRVEEKREVSKDRPRSLTLFIFKGDPASVDELQSRMVFREHDVIERYSPEELRGILTHLREVQPGEVEKIFERFKTVKGYSNLKCLLIPIRSQKDYEGDLVGAVESALGRMTVGQVMPLSF